jgi:hypothetical protein
MIENDEIVRLAALMNGGSTFEEFEREWDQVEQGPDRILVAFVAALLEGKPVSFPTCAADAPPWASAAVSILASVSERARALAEYVGARIIEERPDDSVIVYQRPMRQ